VTQALGGVILDLVDPLQELDIRDAARTSASEKLAQALELMDLGLRWKSAQLRREFPDAPEEEIERRFREWLLADD
jgi:hypothetical protein